MLKSDNSSHNKNQLQQLATRSFLILNYLNNF